MAKKFPPITNKQIEYCILQAVKNFPNNKNFSVNTFAFVDSGKAMQSENLGHTWNSYKNGEFWSRAWVMGGAKRDEIKKQYPILAIEQKGSYRPELCGPTKCFAYDLALMDIIECSNCQKWKKDRTVRQIDCDLDDVLDALLEEILSCKQYKIFIKDEENPGEYIEVIMMLSEGEYLQYVQDNPGKPIQEGDSLEMMVKNTKIEISSWGRGYEHIRGKSLRLEFCGCVVKKEKFNYGNHEPNKYIGTDICSTC